MQGERGYVIMSSPGPEAVLTVLAQSNAKPGLMKLWRIAVPDAGAGRPGDSSGFPQWG